MNHPTWGFSLQEKMWQRVMSGTGWGSRLVEPEMTGLGNRGLLVRFQLELDSC